MKQSVLVFGGHGSIGSTIVEAFYESGSYEVKTAGIRPDESYKVDLENAAQVVNVFRKEHFDHVVVASGVNRDANILRMGLHRIMSESFATNCSGPMVALQAWLKAQKETPKGHFVVLGSNSAYIPRSESLAYCASKAALNMAIRTAARYMADKGPTIWAVDPGWVEDSYMSREFLRKRQSDVPPHRIPGNRTLQAGDLAYFIYQQVEADARYLNGCTLRLDGGEI
jgi:NAD(P)-dependent dehydrogenase (short-subunit alcohol dehydrogenase family)